MTATIIKSMMGLGDNIYQRAFIKNMGECWIDTPWPEIYEDLPNVHFMRPFTVLRTQRKNILRQDQSRYSLPPDDARKIKVSYSSEGIIAGMKQSFGVQPGEFELPSMSRFTPKSSDGSPLAIVRPVTVRQEWRNESRNPLPEYVHMAAEYLIQMGFTVVSVADLSKGDEWAVDHTEPVPATVRHEHGELSVVGLMNLIEHASIVVGPVGWIVPACIAYKTPAWVICGGQGHYNHPSKITHSSMDLSNIEFAVPDNMCMCKEKQHECDKTITGHLAKFRAFVDSRTRRGLASS